MWSRNADQRNRKTKQKTKQKKNRGAQCNVKLEKVVEGSFLFDPKANTILPVQIPRLNIEVAEEY